MNITGEEDQTVYISHADCPQQKADALADFVGGEVPCKDISVGYIGPIVGTSVGPDAIGVWGFGKQVAFIADKAK